MEEVLRLTEEKKKADGAALGIEPGFDNWRDSMPEARLPEKGALDIMLESAKMEKAIDTNATPPTTSKPEELPLIEEPEPPKPKPNADGTPGEVEPPEPTEAEMLAISKACGSPRKMRTLRITSSLRLMK